MAKLIPTSAASGRSLLFLFLLACSLPYVRPAPVPGGPPSWLSPYIPKKDMTIADEIKCYALPYGLIGSISHILTYWTVFWLGFARKPYWPWAKLSFGRYDMGLAVIQMLITVTISSFTIVRCQNRWQLLLLAVWKLTMSITVGFWGIWAGHKVKIEKNTQYEPREPPYEITWRFRASHDPVTFSMLNRKIFTLGIYCMSLAVGFVGTISLVHENIGNGRIQTVTGSFFGAVGFCTVIGGFSYCCCHGRGHLGDEDGGSVEWRGTKKAAVNYLLSFILILGAFYCDWVLAVLAHNLKGVPSGDIAWLYWIYFAAKRILLFSS